MLHVLALAVLPALILIYYTYQQDKLQREPVKNLVKAFFYGWASPTTAKPSLKLLAHFHWQGMTALPVLSMKPLLSLSS